MYRRYCNVQNLPLVSIYFVPLPKQKNNQSTKYGNRLNHSLLTDFDTSLFGAGKHYPNLRKLGSHIIEVDCQWASISPFGRPMHKPFPSSEFQSLEPRQPSALFRWDSSGIWGRLHPGIGKGELYKYHIHARTAATCKRATPLHCSGKYRPYRLYRLGYEYEWKDKGLMDNRKNISGLDKPYWYTRCTWAPGRRSTQAVPAASVIEKLLTKWSAYQGDGLHPRGSSCP